jgi:hypothetical protein
MTDAILLDQITARWRMLDYAWMFYVLVALAAVVAVAAVPSIRESRRAVRIFAVGFGLFAFSNLLGMLYTIKQWHALADELRKRIPATTASDWEGAGLSDAPLGAWVLIPHLLADGFVVAAILWLGSRQSSTAK